ncbi:hypothetical protein GCM10010439_49860 [Actinocorallia aurantiaca]|uniref:Uncharacterized protein n=1 Tax=Actinocorallia aurantiaca TaxID=46204 RepID=A0ABP6GX35_9ACTN
MLQAMPGMAPVTRSSQVEYRAERGHFRLPASLNAYDVPAVSRARHSTAPVRQTSLRRSSRRVKAASKAATTDSQPLSSALPGSPDRFSA